MSDPRHDDIVEDVPDLPDDFVDPEEVEAIEEAVAESFAAAAGVDDADGSGTVENDGATAPVDSQVDRLAAVERERDDYLDALRRLQADFENYKKRMMRQQTELIERAGEGLVEKLLPVLDAIDLARQHETNEGVEQLATALVDALTKEGLERVGTVGDAFDPNDHEAVSHQPAEEGDDGQVVAVLMRAGYRWKGKLLRPAMVAVRG